MYIFQTFSLDKSAIPSGSESFVAQQMKNVASACFADRGYQISADAIELREIGMRDDGHTSVLAEALIPEEAA